jgi:alpha-ketoglutarate-dependent taurine dioxygenase
MKLNTRLYTQPLSNLLGQTIINRNNSNILDLDRSQIIDLFHSYGVLLFRGFDADVETFTQFSNSLSSNFINYAGGVFNRKIINNDPTVLTVNDFKDEVKLHGEMYYQKTKPLMIWFFCATPPLENGQTIVCDGRQFFEALPEHLKDLLLTKKLKYTGHSSQEAWQKRYKTDDLEEVKAIFLSNDIQVQVNEDQSVDLQYICPAIHPSRQGDYRTFINSLLPARKLSPNSISFEDDSKIPDDIMTELYDIGEKLTTEINWQKGDILMIDNTRIMHGRRMITDDQRDIYIRLCSPSFAF